MSGRSSLPENEGVHEEDKVEAFVLPARQAVADVNAETFDLAAPEG